MIVAVQLQHALIVFLTIGYRSPYHSGFCSRREIAGAQFAIAIQVDDAAECGKLRAIICRL